MQLVKGIQHTAPRSNAILNYTDRDWTINCDEFVVKRAIIDDLEDIRLFFPLPTAPQTGVGLSFDSSKTAIAVARALLTIAEGCANEIKGNFTN